MTSSEFTWKQLGTLAVFVVLVGSPIGFGIFGKGAEAGLSILACSLALAFIHIDKLKRFKGGGFEAEMKDQIDAMVAAESEPEQDAEPSGVSVEGYGLDPAAQQIVNSLNSSRYTWRSIGGICKESGLSRQTVLRQLQWLEQVGLALKVGTGRGANWGLTKKGREVALS